MPVSDERDGEPQPGDLVIETIDGVPHVYTQPEAGQPVPGRDELLRSKKSESRKAKKEQ